jgi:two-component system response regulator AtoC
MSDPSTASGHGPGSRPPVVFFVDDEEGIRSIWSLVLRQHGYEVIEAGFAEEAVSRIETVKEPIDVLLMDINLPDGWGASVAQRLRESHPEMTVVYTTGYAATDPILSGGLGDAPFVIRKPSPTEELLRVVAAALAVGRSGSEGE